MKLFIPIVFSTALLGCAAQPNNAGDDRNNAVLGALVGVVAGAVVGGQLDDDGNRDKGVILGALAGAAAGAGVGHYMDKQEQEFRDALAAGQRRSDIEIERVREDLLKLTFDNEVTFDLNRTEIKSSFFTSLDKVAEVMRKYRSKGEVVGHTDSIGSENYNQSLSERRAEKVASYLIGRGVDNANVISLGRGEYEPRESNVTEAGRALNRRVEVYVTPSAP